MTEFELIRHYFAGATGPAVRLGVGDDAALLSLQPEHELVISCDTMVSGRHFTPDADPFSIGWKGLHAAASDLAAMGARPLGCLLALTLPEADRDWLEAFARGMAEAAKVLSLPLVGGDTTRGPLTVSVTVNGETPVDGALRRAGARPGDLLAVTGTLGDAAAALAGADDAFLQQRLHRPVARLAEGQALRGLARAAVDLSDGLLADVGHLCAASRVGADIRADLLPASDALMALETTASERLGWQVAGGEDYELALAISPDVVRHAMASCEQLGTSLTVIGRFRAGEGVRLLQSNGQEITMETAGYRHF